MVRDSSCAAPYTTAVEDLRIREMKTDDVPRIVEYWRSASESHLRGMGVDLSRMPPPHALEARLLEMTRTPIESRPAYCVVWLFEGEPVGHSNTNPTRYGVDAMMHLHLWHAESRRRGLGTAFLRLTVPHFFERLRLQALYAEPFADNPPPHRALERAGFELEREYVTTPGSINFEQRVKRWRKLAPAEGPA